MENLHLFIDQVREKQPLIHNITNQVVINFTANGLLALGAAPVMANATEEAGDMAGVADALLLNIGTLTSPQIEAMIVAGKAANQKGIPVVFDPVGVGATTFRNDAAARILREVDVTIVRGNAGEIGFLAGLDSEVRGVESAFTGSSRDVAVQAARKLGIPVIVTGKEDTITDGKRILIGENGDAILTKVTGTGCLLSSVVAAFLSVGEDTLESAAAAVSFYGAAAELAVKDAKGPGSFQTGFLDELASLDSNTFSQSIKLREES